MSQFESYVVAWADPGAPLPEPSQAEPLRDAAGDLGGELLAYGRVHGVVETDARPVPTWVTVAGFTAEDHARTWADLADGRLPETVLLLPAIPEPVWWASEREDQRPDWSRRLEPPADRLGWVVSVWVDVLDLDPFLHYAGHFKWTIEHNGGAALGTAAFPSVLRGEAGPGAMGLMAFPNSDAHFNWHTCADYRPYRDIRHRSARATVVGLPTLRGEIW